MHTQDGKWEALVGSGGHAASVFTMVSMQGYLASRSTLSWRSIHHPPSLPPLPLSQPKPSTHSHVPLSPAGLHLALLAPHHVLPGRLSVTTVVLLCPPHSALSFKCLVNVAGGPVAGYHVTNPRQDHSFPLVSSIHFLLL